MVETNTIVLTVYNCSDSVQCSDRGNYFFFVAIYVPCRKIILMHMTHFELLIVTYSSYGHYASI